MAPRKKDDGDEEKPSRSRRPAGSPQEYEDRLINLAYVEVEKRLRSGTATSQETTHFLKMGSSREKLEKQKMEYEARLAEAKIDSIAAQARQEGLYGRAIRAMVEYTGGDPDEFEELDQYKEPDEYED